jgi:hypothetical protein
MTEAYIDYCLDNCRRIIKCYKLEGGKNEWGFLESCLRQFQRECKAIKRYSPDRTEMEYLNQAIAYLQENGVALWQDYKDDPEYRKEIGQSYLWTRGGLSHYRHPPKNFLELDLVFGAMECFMMLEEKDLLAKPQPQKKTIKTSEPNPN